MAYVPPRGPPTPQPPPDAGLPPHLHPPPPFPGGPPPHHFPPHHMHGPPPPPPHGHGPYAAPPPPHAGHGQPPPHHHMPPPHHHMHSGPFGAPPHRPPPPPHGHVPPRGHGPPPPPFEAGFGPPHHPPPPGPPFHHHPPHHHDPMPTTPGDNTAPYHPPPPHHAFVGDAAVPRPLPPHGSPHMRMGGRHMMSMPRGPPRHPAPRIEPPHADPSSYPAKAFTHGLDGQSSPEVVGQDATTGGPKSMRARVELKQDENTLYVLSNGVPNYQPRSSSGEDLTTDWTRVGPARAGRLDFNPGAIFEQEHVFYIPLRPQDTGSSWKALYDVTAAGGGSPPRGPPGMMGRQQGPMWTPMGPIGVAINGVPLFNQYSAIMDDAVETESFDVCCGHPVPGIGAYHYHQFPKCVRGSRALGVNTTDDQRLGADTTTATTTTASPHPPPSSPSPSTPAGPSTIPTASAAPSTVPTASASAVQTSTEDIPVAQVVTSSDLTTEITMDPTPVPGVVLTSAALPPATVVTTEKEGGGLLQATTAGGGDVSDTTPSTTTEAELLAEEAAVAAALLDLVAQGDGHSAIVGYSFDGYPIYGPVGWSPKGSAKVMRSSYQRRGQDHEFVEGSGDLDVCNGIVGPTPEYPEGVYHYHCTVDAASLQQGRVVATYPYVIGRYRGVPNVRNFPPFLLDMPGASSAQQGRRR